MFDSTLDDKVIAQAIGISDLDLDAADQAELIDGIRTLVNERVGIRVESSLTSEDLEAFAKLGDDRAAIKAFVEAKVPNIARLYEEELAGIVADLEDDLETN